MGGCPGAVREAPRPERRGGAQEGLLCRREQARGRLIRDFYGPNTCIYMLVQALRSHSPTHKGATTMSTSIVKSFAKPLSRLVLTAATLVAGVAAAAQPQSDPQSLAQQLLS